MKCNNCGKRMKTVLGDTHIQVENNRIEVKNIPVFNCPSCGRQLIHDIVIQRAENYIHQYGAENNSIDFGKCEQIENEDAITIMQTLGIL